MTKLKKHPENIKLSRDERGSFVLPAPHPGAHLPSFHNVHIQILTSLTKLVGAVRSLKPEQYIIGLAIASQIAFFLYTVNFLIPKNINFSYANSSCISNPVVLPSLHSSSVSNAYQLSARGGLSLGGLRLTSTSTCVQMTSVANTENESISLSPKHLNFLSKKINISTPAKPELASSIDIKLMPTNTPLIVNLDQADKIFEYRLLGNNKEILCTKIGTELSCDVSKLELKQSKIYDFTLKQMFNGAPVGILLSRKIATVEALRVIKSSIKSGSTVYDKPQSVTISFSKEVKSFNNVELIRLADDKEIPIKVLASTKGKVMTVSFADNLSRQSKFKLVIEQAIAPDKGALSKPYTLEFYTSGGPKIVSTNIGSYGVTTSQNIVLNFDSTIASKQNMTNFIKITANDKTLPVASFISGNTVTIDPASNLPFCTNFSVRLSDGFSSSYGVTGGSAWSMDSRTTCHTTSVIGASVQGRAILAYHFGSGTSKIVFFGNMHGDEASAKSTLDSWVDELEANYVKIPKNRTIIVVPSLNPDGLVAGTRNNAHNVDLNRNFPESNWKTDVQKPSAGGEIIKGGGGSAPLSEPESKALANLIQAENPRLVLSYHAVGSVIISNTAGDANSVASIYSTNSGYWLPGGSEAEGVFGYEITGTLEGWLYESYGTPTLVIELSSYYGSSIYSNRGAMWAMATLP